MAWVEVDPHLFQRHYQHLEGRRVRIVAEGVVNGADFYSKELSFEGEPFLTLHSYKNATILVEEEDAGSQ